MRFIHFLSGSSLLFTFSKSKKNIVIILRYCKVLYQNEGKRKSKKTFSFSARTLLVYIILGGWYHKILGWQFIMISSHFFVKFIFGQIFSSHFRWFSTAHWCALFIFCPIHFCFSHFKIKIEHSNQIQWKSLIEKIIMRDCKVLLYQRNEAKRKVQLNN